MCLKKIKKNLERETLIVIKMIRNIYKSCVPLCFVVVVAVLFWYFLFGGFFRKIAHWVTEYNYLQCNSHDLGTKTVKTEEQLHVDCESDSYATRSSKMIGAQ